MKDIAQTQQRRLELPAVTLTWHAGKYKVHKLHQRCVLKGKFGTWLVLKMLVTADSDNKMDTQKQVVSAKLSKMVVCSTVHI